MCGVTLEGNVLTVNVALPYGPDLGLRLGCRAARPRDCRLQHEMLNVLAALSESQLASDLCECEI